MFDPRYVAEHFNEVAAGLARRSPEAAAQLAPAAELAERRRALVQKTEGLQAERNQANQAMAELAKSGDKVAFAEHRERLKALSAEVKRLETELSALEGDLEAALAVVPNLPHESVPIGTSEKDNRVVRVVGTKPELSFEAREHFDVAEGLGLVDFERAAKLSGSRFAVLMGFGARLGRALAQYMLQCHTERHGYTEVYTPYLVRASALYGTGQLPKFEQDVFRTSRRGPDSEQDGEDVLYMIPTAEVTLTNLHAGEIVDGAQLPLAYTAQTPCFRSEAGSYGRDVRGLIRQHQFEKVELVRLVKPEQGLAELELLTSHAEAVLQGLGLHYRVVELCSGDLGFSARKTYDLEVWLPGQGAYREISSCSWCGDFQARRAKIRFRTEPKSKPELVHTLNGSGVAVGRALVAVLEQYQQADGSLVVPEVLRPWVGTDLIVPAH